MKEKHILPEKRDDWRKVRKYIDAVNAAIYSFDPYLKLFLM